LGKLQFADQTDLRAGEPTQAGDQVPPPLGDVHSQFAALAYQPKDGSYVAK
jgi:hypothetical protein